MAEAFSTTHGCKVEFASARWIRACNEFSGKTPARSVQSRSFMLIRSTPQACFVILKNGLTLELFYDEALTGIRNGVTPSSASDAPQSEAEG
jgi:hypothetical protein